MRFFGAVILCLLLFVSSCIGENGKDSHSSSTLFKKLDAGHTGITFSNILIENDSINYFTYSYIYMGGGVAAGDINNDGLIDLYFTGNMVPNKLYLNKGNLTFEDITDKARVGGDQRWFTGATMADVNGDGFLDIYCSVGGKFDSKKNVFYLNNGDATFSERAAAFGIDDHGNSVQGTFFDYDRDGDLDLYVANYPPTPFSSPIAHYKEKMANPSDFETDKLFRNDGAKFTDVTDNAGLRSFGLTLSATAADLNGDGWQDIYVSNDFGAPDYLFLNQRDGTFVEKIKEATRNTSFYGMGVDIADYNNDGLLDIFQVDMSPKDNRRAKANMASMNPKFFSTIIKEGFHYQYMQNSLQLNIGVLRDSVPNFSNVSRLAGVASTDWSWAPLFADLDNDGWKDLFVANGTRKEINNRDFFNAFDPSKYRNKSDSLLAKSHQIPSEKIDNFVFRNKQDLTFEKANADWGIEYKGFSNGSVYVDLDNDGDLELVLNNIDNEAVIFENTNVYKNHYLTLKLEGNDQNTHGLGSKVTIKTKNGVQFQELTLSRGFQSAVAPQLHFGLGNQEEIIEIKVIWPDGKVQFVKNSKADQTMVLKQSNAQYPQGIEMQTEAKLFNTVTDTLFPKYRHEENVYDDYEKEILLPHKTSTFGPGLAVGDLNGDGKDDFFVGGAATFPSGVFYQTTMGGFEQQEIKTLTDDLHSEDLGALIFDPDNDGDQDIYVVSGGNEFAYNSKALQDRLYINDGIGGFSKSITGLPEMITSGSRVHQADYDHDGDPDLFVGGRLIPGNYPLPTDSYILENISTKGNPKFRDATLEIAPDLKEIGLVTSASWTDYDADGWVDLIVVGEWMPLTVFHNEHGVFKNVTEDLGLEDTRGWWFSIASGDFDDDGDMDFIAGNLGLNYKYQASANETFDIYIGDFDKNKRNDIILSYYNDGEKYPIRGRECSSQQIPEIKEKFKDYNSFSTATLEDVYGKKKLSQSLQYKVKSFASVYLENNNGNFTIHELPIPAQTSSINQILVKDFDYDGHLDAVIAGNLYGSEVETPRADAGIGLFLKGNGKGDFDPIPARESGLFLDGDVKDMQLISIQGKPYVLGAKNDDFLQFVACFYFRLVF